MKGNSSIDEDSLWTPQLEKIFIDIMLKEINKGNMADGKFSSNTWKKMLATLNELGKRSFTMTQFKGKLNRMRLLHQSPTQDLVMAILESNITIRSSKRPSDSSDERPSKSKRELMSSQMNDVLQSMVEAAKARIEASKAKAERYKR
uniref:Myb/SANT-like domain-containing protein n=1 Tax=Quercus lobata TaxID=97700 RepID=A0A7N2LMV5_QUELO